MSQTHRSSLNAHQILTLVKCTALCLCAGSVVGCASIQPSGSFQKRDTEVAVEFVEGQENGQIYGADRAAEAGPRALPSPQLVITPEVDRQLQRFAIREREYIESALPYYGKYYTQIAQIFRQQGVPEDLINLAIVESRFHPHARSHRGAVGLWQLMSRTARSFGLKTWGRDERKDPIRSSVAAAKYLRQLYEILGDWYLALAAYNGGIGRLTQAMVDTGIFDFWELARSGKLARETADFVPRFIAIALIMNDPEKYGFEVAFDREGGDAHYG